MKKLLLPALALVAAATFLGGRLIASASSQDKAQAVPEVSAADLAVIQVQLPSYPQMACPVSGEALGGEMGDPLSLVRNDRLIRVCCKGCIKKVDKDPAAMIAAIDAAVISEQSIGYPLTTCPISGKSLGEPIEYVHGTRLVRFCCEDCQAKFVKDPAPTMAKLDAALIATQLETYTVDVCPVSGEKLGEMGEPINMLYGTHLVRLCCKNCVKAVNKDGAAIVAKVASLSKPMTPLDK